MKRDDKNKTISQLDRIDRKILEVLRHDGRISYQRLSEMVYLTPRPCQERVRRLEQAGIIRGYTAIIDDDVHRLGVILHAKIAFSSQSGRSAQQAFEAEVQSRPEVLDCWLVSGQFDYVVRIHCADMDQYRTLTSEWLASEVFKIEKIVSDPEMQVIKGAGITRE
ncbi:Lrp/AsnC family transcriptional regulator [Paludibacterium purpuratum]|uniref:Lrp/AsnC family leucine-responsive transcriptional regulator n=1 Tax=Paludibacterium purpuratum TaxID=1144873 RepID=A0A4R7B9A9_9NEIS|nr:Lrp/AsnC family transcriptional regulator [Paludibacterium purpuratum]TDR81470.1 Lrp/AsnC family leucine-responsive transcriptional regulator [Paludibacterium purpuratum]